VSVKTQDVNYLYNLGLTRDRLSVCMQ